MFDLNTGSISLIIIIICIFGIIYTKNKDQQIQNFEIEPNTVMGGYKGGPSLFELEGPGNAGTDGY